MRLSGMGGTVRVGGRLAASLGTWKFEGSPRAGGEWALTAAVQQRDAFWLAGDGPFDLTLHVGTRRWCWRRVPLAVDADALTIQGQGEAQVANAE